MPEGDISRMMILILDYLRQGSLVGFVLFIGTAIEWFFHARNQRRLINGEMDRIAEQKSQLQKKLIGDKIESSKPLKQKPKKSQEG